MITENRHKKHWRCLLIFAMCMLGLSSGTWAQSQTLVNLAMLDGAELTPDNLFNYQVQSGFPAGTNAEVRGVIRYRNSEHRISYRFRVRLQPGINTFSRDMVRPEFTYSSSALKELFELYKKLPQGIYEYCVQVQPEYFRGEGWIDAFDECLYNKSEDLFMITLVDPENDAKIYEYNPMLSWVVTYPFSAGLTYRIRVAEMKEGQHTIAAVTRNNPVYQERNLTQSSVIYPLYAKPLQKNQPYAWTVDAYYKGVLLGGAEPWKFTIVDDSLFEAAGRNVSYIDVQRERGTYEFYAPGVLKLKYTLEDLEQDSLSLQIFDKRGKEVGLKNNVWMVRYGDNRKEIWFHEERPLKHLQPYTLRISSPTGASFTVAFKYANPELLK